MPPIELLRTTGTNALSIHCSGGVPFLIRPMKGCLPAGVPKLTAIDRPQRARFQPDRTLARAIEWLQKGGGERGPPPRN
jgi:hypothetical protein